MATAAPPRSLPPAAPGLPAKVPSNPPNQTLYVRNLPSSKIQKSDLRTALYMLFSTYGPVLGVVALKTMKMRGQAHIVFRDVQASTQAMRALDGFQFLGNELKVSYAKSKSKIISQLDGTFVMPSTSAAANVEISELQQSIFNAPVPGSSTAAPPPAARGLPSRHPTGADGGASEGATPESRGQKRGREDEDEDEDSDVAMEEDSDDD